MAPPNAPEAGPPTILQASTSGSRSRTQARRRANDDAAYFGSGGAFGVKRSAEKPESEPRVKRKRVEAPSSAVGTSSNARRPERDRPPAESNSRTSLVDFSTLPSAAIYRYLSQFDLIPPVYPSPLTAGDPPNPTSLQNSQRHNSRPPSPTVPATPANRPRRESKDQSRRRSSRLLEEDLVRTPILADVGAVHTTLAGIAERHFQQHSVREVDTVASFISHCKVAKTLA